jgi:hypothetical protein
MTTTMMGAETQGTEAQGIVVEMMEAVTQERMYMIGMEEDQPPSQSGGKTSKWQRCQLAPGHDTSEKA